MPRRAWGWSSRAQERKDQARREDDEFWSDPTYFHGTTDRNGWGEGWDPEHKDWYSSKQHEQQRAARKEAQKKAERKERHTEVPPPPDPFYQGKDRFKPKAEKDNERQEAWEKAEKDEREDDGCWWRPRSPQQPDSDWSEKMQNEYLENLEKYKRAKQERSKRRKAEREQSDIDKLPFLLIKVINIQVDIVETVAKVDESRSAMKARDSRSDLPSIETSVFWVVTWVTHVLSPNKGILPLVWFRE